MQLKKLDWDSDFFEMKIGSASIACEADLKFFTQTDKTNFDLIYVFSNQLIDKLIPIDERVEFEREIFPTEIVVENDIVCWKGNSTKDLIALSIDSGHQSRFKKDEKLAPKFEKLYKRWIEKSVEGKLADYVLVAQENNKIIGMLTLKIKDNCSEIGLIAASVKGKGIGKKLMQKAFELTQKHKKNTIKVVTQKNNIEAMLFYEKLGFSIHKINYVYHYWITEEALGIRN